MRPAITLSRRELLLSPLEVGLGLPIQASATNGARVRVIHNNDSEFDMSLSNLQSISSQLQQVRDFSVILRNEGDCSAKAYCIRWLFQDEKGHQRETYAQFVLKHSMPKRAAHDLKPGTSRLISPFFNVATSGVRNTLGDLKNNPHLQSPYLNATNVSISLDAVVYADGQCEGPDVYGLTTLFRATRSAEHDEGVSILLKVRSSQNVHDLDGFLARHMHLSALAEGTSADAHYTRARGYEAELMRRLLASNGVKALVANATRRARYPRDPSQAGA